MVVSVVEVAAAAVEGWRERVTEAAEVAEEMEEAMAVAVDRSHVHGARNGASRTTRSAITQVAPRNCAMYAGDLCVPSDRDEKAIFSARFFID